MQPELSATLAPPLASDALRWHVAEVEPGAARARLEPYATRAAIAERLDVACGRLGWSFSLAPLGASALVANLTVRGATRSDVIALCVPSGGVPLPDALARSGEFALARCAAQFGLRLPYVSDDPSYWVDFDAEAGEALFEPEPVCASAGPGPLTAQAGQGVVAATAAGTGATPAVAAAAAAAAAVEEADSERATEPPPQKTGSASGGHEVIERLIERLNAEGLGREAAKLVVRYGGYGRTPEESRELYRQLRSILLQREAQPA